MRTALVLGFVLLATLALAAEYQVYQTAWTAEPNITLNYSKIPWVLRGVTPRLEPPQQLRFDTVLEAPSALKIDPRTCPGEVALCYQIREHNFTASLTGGKNYSALSSYVLPERRIKTFVCLGNNTGCVAEATNCFCPQKVPEQPLFLSRRDTCSDGQHLCRNTYASLTLCQGNLSWCSEHHLACGCGKYAACHGITTNTCVNGRNELVLCLNTLPGCLNEYDTCFCGDQLALQKDCTALRHACQTGGRNATCIGTFAQCALKHETCTCGT